MNKKAFIYKNKKELSIETAKEVRAILEAHGYELKLDYPDECDVAVCVGGDGTLLGMLHNCNFPKVPIIGVNTGKLGFFQDALPENFEDLLSSFEEGSCKIQTIRLIEAVIKTSDDIYHLTGVNDFLIRGPLSCVSQFGVAIGDTQIQNISGDGLLVSTPVGSTAYNYSLDGSIVAPNLNVLQLTPVAPMNTSAYRCFHSSIILPADQKIRIKGIDRSANGSIIISYDGRIQEFDSVSDITINQSDKLISLVRFQNYDYWKKLTSKLL